MTKYISFLCLLLVMTACHKAYPGLYAPEIDYENPNPEVSTDHVPVMLSMYDPLYALVTTRKYGTFEAWGSSEEAQKHWMDARFGVYAFLTNNALYTGGPDYTKPEADDDTGIPYCLVKDRKVRLTKDCELLWEDEVSRYYSATYPEYKFNFFLYYLDNANVTGETQEYNKVVKHIEVDGTQDILSAYAYPDAHDRDKLVADDDESRYLINHWNDVVYSARSGRRRIDPNFKVKHEMTQLQFTLEGMKPVSSKITVEAVIVTIPYRGNFTVAADWDGVRLDNAGMEPPTGVVWDYTATKDIYLSENKQADFDETTKRENGRLGLSVAMAVTKNAGRAILVPPAPSYKVSVWYRYDDMDYPALQGKLFNVVFEKMTLPGSGAFSAGGRHVVNLQIYGPQLINLTVDRSSLGWTEYKGGYLDVDSEWD